MRKTERAGDLGTASHCPQSTHTGHLYASSHRDMRKTERAGDLGTAPHCPQSTHTGHLYASGHRDMRKTERERDGKGERKRLTDS